MEIVKCVIKLYKKVTMPSNEAASSTLLDYSNKNLKKVPKFDEVDKQSITVLLLDSNELQKLENIDSFVRVEKVSYTRNHSEIHLNKRNIFFIL